MIQSLLDTASRCVVGLLRLLLRAYQLLISPILGPACRFSPSCSQYARDSLLAHGPLRGSWLALCRLGRCNPWNPGGHDPVPPARQNPGLRSGTAGARSHD